MPDAATTSPTTVSPPTTSAAPSPTIPSVPEHPPAEIVASFAQSAIGERVRLGVLEQAGTKRCRLHGFVPAGDVSHHVGVYLSDCRDWERGGLDLYFFFVELENIGERRVEFARSAFVLIDARGRRHRPVGVRAHADRDRLFVPPEGRIRPGESVRGFLAFDADPNFVPRRLRYRDGGQRLVVVFVGGRRVLDDD